MQRTLLLLSLCVADPLSSGVESRAQSDAWEALNRQLDTFRFHSAALSESRGVSTAWYYQGAVRVHMLVEALGDYGGQEGAIRSAILFYHFEGDSLHGWLLSRRGIEAHQAWQSSPNTLALLQAQVRTAFGVDGKSLAQQQSRGARVESGDVPLAGPQALARIQKEVAAQLLPPALAGAVKRLAGDSTLNLIVVPEATIASFPLYALQPFGDGSYLIDHATLTVASSLDEMLRWFRFLSEDGNGISGATDTVSYKPIGSLVVGNPDFSRCSRVFLSLPGAEAEARYAAKTLGMTPLIGAAVIKKAILESTRKSEILYFATHGVASADDVLNESYLALGGDSCARWTAKEIQHDTFQREAIVILSACQTGLGRSVAGGIIGVSRVFILGGAGNVMMSLWSVDDAATATLMRYFMDELRQPHRAFPAGALRAAMLKYKEENPAPAAWAAFTNMGTPYPPGCRMRLVVE